MWHIARSDERGDDTTLRSYERRDYSRPPIGQLSFARPTPSDLIGADTLVVDTEVRVPGVLRWRGAGVWESRCSFV